MAVGIYLVQHDKQLVEMREETYESENLLQELIDRYPSILAGDQVNSQAPRKWLAIGREIGIPDDHDAADRWSLDHLLLDQDAIPTFVEVKRSKNRQIRREVVGQLLDYVANATTYLPAERMRERFQAEHSADSGASALHALLGSDADVEAYWQKARTNLQAGRVRLVFVADKIPRELARVVEFLNKQMQTVDVLALEIRQYVGEYAGAKVRTLVPRVIGDTEEARVRKAVAGTEQPHWDRQSFFVRLTETHDKGVEDVVCKLEHLASAEGLDISWGTNRSAPLLHASKRSGGTNHILFRVSTSGYVRVLVNARPPLANAETTEAILAHIARLPDLERPPTDKIGAARVPLAALANDENLQQFQRSVREALEALPGARVAAESAQV